MQNTKNQFKPSSLIGLKEEDAKRIIEMNIYGWLVSQRDGQYTVTPRYIQDDIVVLKIEDSIITDAYFS